MKKRKKPIKVLDLYEAGIGDAEDWNKRLKHQFKGDAKEYTRALKAGFNFMDKRMSRTHGTRGDFEDFTDIYKDVKNTKISDSSWEKANALTDRWRNFLSNEASQFFSNNIRRNAVQTLGDRTYVNFSSSNYTRTGKVRKRKRKDRTTHERIANHNEEVAAWLLYKALRDAGEDVDLKTGIADYISPYILALVSIFENKAGHRLNVITDIEEIDAGGGVGRVVSFKFAPRVLKALQKIVPKIEKEEKEGKGVRIYTNKYENFRKLPNK